MGHEGDRRGAQAVLAFLAATLLLILAPSAQAVPFHPRSESLDVTGLNHACGVAVDNKGDLYLASAGTSKIKVYNPSHVLLTEITDANTPCGLALTTSGNLYVSEKATGEVVRFKPNKYPFEGTPTYGSREVIDSSTKAKGIAVDPKDNRLYVAEGTRVAVYKSDGTFEANVGEGKLTEASGVAAYTYSNGAATGRYLWVADAAGVAADKLVLFAAAEEKALALRRELSAGPDGAFGFGAAGAYLAADPGNRIGEKCVAVAEQACSAGHLFLYDATHKALDEFDATGEFLDRTANASFADAEPSAIAIDRSGGTNDGTLYVTAGAGAGAKALAFGPLKAPKRETLGEPLSHILKSARAVATDPNGDVYALAEGVVYVFGPKGEAITQFEDEFLPRELAVDSAGNVYVLDVAAEFTEEEPPKEIAGVTYYAPSSYPPKAATSYSRHEPLVASLTSFPKPKTELLRAIAVNPGPSAGKDQLFIASNAITRRYKSAAEGSELLDGDFGKGLVPGTLHLAIAVNGSNGTLYTAVNTSGIYALNAAGTELLAHFDTKGSPSGNSTVLPSPAVDQSDGHVISFDKTSTAREYDAAGSFVAEFGNFTEGLSIPTRVAVDNACVIHEPPLDETTTPTCKEFDPASGNVYVAFDDPNLSHPPYDVTAFGPLKYPAAPPHKLTVKTHDDTGTGTVTSSPEGIDCGATCSAKFEETKVVTLTAKADELSESKFKGWTGCEFEEKVSPTEGICEVTMSKDQEVSAEFHAEGEEFKLEVEPVGPGSGKVTSHPPGIECPSTCSHKFVKNVSVSLEAEADEESEFIKWSGCDSVNAEGECLVSLTSDRKITVEFDILHPLLTVVEEGGGTGTVTGPGIECPSTCSHKFELHDDVTLNAQPDPGSVFAGWKGCDAETVSEDEGTCEVEMNKEREVTAVFAALPEPIAKSAQPISYTEATLRGEVDPSGLPTEYRFEYLTEEEYEANGETFEEAQQTPIGKLGAASGFVAVEAPLVGLEEGTKYRFRLRVMNAVGPAEDEGPPFETRQRRAAQPCPNTEYRTGLSANLPDCRAYELVTPAQTNGLVPDAGSGGTSPSGTFSQWLTPQRGEAAGAGERLSYFTNGTLPDFEGNGMLDGYLAERGEGEHPAGGWQSTLFGPSYVEAAPGIKGPPFRLGVSSDQLYSVWEINPEPETFPGTLPQGVYLHTPSDFEALGRGSLGSDLKALSRYVSASGAHAIFSSDAHLEEEAPPAGNMAIYDRAAGSSSAHVLTLPPDNAPEEEEREEEEAEFAAALLSKEQANYRGASEDGATTAFKVGVVLFARLDDARTERIGPSDAPTVGDPLTCAAGPLIGASGPPLGPNHGRQFLWLRNANTPVGGGIDTSISTDHITVPADEAAALQCQVRAFEGDTGSVAVSAPVEIAPLEAGKTPQPPIQIAPPTPAAPEVGDLETCDPGSWKGTESLAYQWYANGEPITGATAQTYEVQAGDVPGSLQCVVKGTNTAATVARASGITPTSPAPTEAAPIATAQAAPKTTYAGTSEDGRYVFFALGNGESPDRLFRFDTQSESTAEIAAAGIFVGVSPDGTHAFFSSTDALTGGEENDNGEEAEAGEHNLYAWNGTETRFLGILSAVDFQSSAFGSPVKLNLAAWTLAVGPGSSGQSGRALAPTRSTPDGGVFVFQSHARLTAYDNEGVGEIYRYDPAAQAGERLLCVSCDPSGVPPTADALLEDVRSVEGVPLDPSTMISSITDNGQEVFFQSFDRLLPEDANEAEDVYEWQAKGTGGCTRPGGCLALISSGQGETPSFLYAMSADGHDVFLQTREKLVGADLAGSPSIYDARVGGGIPEPAPPTPCQGDACQGQGSEPPILPTPTTTGGGESPEATPVPKRCAKGKHRVKGRCVAVKHKHHKHKRRRGHANRGGKR